MVESPRSCATRHSRIRGFLVMVAEVKKRVAQVRICGGVPTRVLCRHTLRLSNERFQVADVTGDYTHNPGRNTDLDAHNQVNECDRDSSTTIAKPKQTHYPCVSQPPCSARCNNSSKRTFA